MMTGKMIVLSGVVAGGAAGGPMVKMTSADQIAANIPALAYVISPSTLKVGADGLLTGRDRASGKLLTAGGSSANLLTVALMGGNPQFVTQVLRWLHPAWVCLRVLRHRPIQRFRQYI
jgi:hypothetical protein